MSYVTMAIYGIVGSVVGSFLNVVIDRLPIGESLLRPQSRCPYCGRALSALDMVPVFSYLFLGRRCRTCGARIPARIFWVELTTALLFAFLWWLYGPTPQLILGTVYSCVLLVVMVVDLEHMLIPDLVIVPATAVALLATALQRWMGQPRFSHYGLMQLVLTSRTGWDLSLTQLGAFSQLLGGGVGFWIFYLVWLVAPQIMGREAMGLGDVKLATFAGLITAYPGALVAVLGSFILGGVVSAALLVAGIAGRKTAIPFGPFLVVTTFLIMVCGDPFMHWYLGG